MQPFLIVADNIETAELEEHFPNAVFPIWEKTWVIASDIFSTSADISNLLFLEKEKDDGPLRTGVIIRIREYHGYFNPALWQKIEAWKEHQ